MTGDRKWVNSATKGPWVIRRGTRFAVNQRGTGRHVAMVSCYKYASAVVHEEENKANAVLIRNAQNVFDALGELVIAVCNSGWAVSSAITSATLNAQVALVRAGGKEITKWGPR